PGGVNLCARFGHVRRAAPLSVIRYILESAYGGNALSRRQCSEALLPLRKKLFDAVASARSTVMASNSFLGFSYCSHSVAACPWRFHARLTSASSSPPRVCSDERIVARKTCPATSC